MSTEVREDEAAYGRGTGEPEIMGVSTASITDAMQRAVESAWLRHKSLGHPIVILRDGKVVEVPPGEIVA